MAGFAILAPCCAGLPGSTKFAAPVDGEGPFRAQPASRRHPKLEEGGTPPILIRAELGLTLLALMLAVCWPRLGAEWFRGTERRFASLARRRGLAVLVVGVVAIAARLAVLPILPVPQPIIADEYSFLLAADTFAHGRLTNPTPVMWQHFETLHVLERPTYMSMYPPAQGLFLAAGLALAHRAFLGLLLSIGLMCAAICWMLQGWFSPGWALVGGFLAVMRFDVFNYWANSYWGGAVAALGGALVLGALPRILKRERAREAILMGVGLAILANSRPYEGLIFSLPVAVVLFAWVWKKRASSPVLAIRRVVLPLALVLTIAGGAMGYYFWRVTGSPWVLPQLEARQTYAISPYFLWEHPRPVPNYRHEALRGFYLHEFSFYQESRTSLGLAGVEYGRFEDFWLFYLGPALTLPLVLAVGTLPFGLRWSEIDGWARFLIVAACVSTAGILAEAFFFAHYAAPMTGLVIALVILAMRRLYAWNWHGRPAGAFVVRAVPLISLLMLAIRAGAVPLGIPITPTWPPSTYNAIPVRSDWVRVERRLESYPGKQLVLVQYSAKGKSQAGFVYNGADMDHGKVIWAWDMGRAENEKLIECYKDRDVWLLDPTTEQARLIPYASSGSGRDESAAPPASAIRRGKSGSQREGAPK
jgi:hypothetical protein